MNVGDSGPVGVAMQGCEFGQALLVRNKVRNLLNQQRHRVNKHRMDTMGQTEDVLMFSVFRILRANFSFFEFGSSGVRIAVGVAMRIPPSSHT